METGFKWINTQILSDDFHGILNQTRHNGQIYPPEKLQDFLIGLQPFRFSLKVGVDLHSGLTMWWFLSDVGIPRSIGVFKNSMDQDLALLGFRLQNINNDRRTYINGNLGEGSEMIIQGPHPFHGGSRASCGLDLYLSLSFNNTENMTYSQWAQCFRQLNFKHLDTEIMQTIERHRLIGISHGGTWERYYSLSLKYSPENKADLESAIGQFVGKGKYRLYKQQDNLNIYENEFLMIYLENGKSSFELRFQPR
ncbi:MAG: hypothetical protein JXR70_14470 [Spirochaetales bacterium]|nr:hypothetical protein [Spirochaetales bacterium]